MALLLFRACHFNINNAHFSEELSTHYQPSQAEESRMPMRWRNYKVSQNMVSVSELIGRIVYYVYVYYTSQAGRASNRMAKEMFFNKQQSHPVCLPDARRFLPPTRFACERYACHLLQVSGRRLENYDNDDNDAAEDDVKTAIQSPALRWGGGGARECISKSDHQCSALSLSYMVLLSVCLCMSLWISLLILCPHTGCA